MLNMRLFSGGVLGSVVGLHRTKVYTVDSVLYINLSIYSRIPKNLKVTDTINLMKSNGMSMTFQELNTNECITLRDAYQLCSGDNASPNQLPWLPKCCLPASAACFEDCGNEQTTKMRKIQ
jgi:hypothetical protein